MNAYEDWKGGTISPIEALRYVTSDLTEVESELEPLTKEREQLRAQVSELVNAVGGRAEIPGYGKLEITSPSKTVKYDTKRIDAVMVRCLREGYPEIAEAISDCMVESGRAGSLRITREKQVPV